MSLDICVESYGSVAPFISNDSVGGLLRASTISRRLPANRHRPDALDIDADTVLQAVDRLPILLIQALWLVDICRLSYDEAADTLSIPRDELAERVRSGREAIHHSLLDGADPTPESGSGDHTHRTHSPPP